MIKDLRNCLLRFALWCDDYENCEHSERDTLTIIKENLEEELKALLKAK